MPNGQAWFRQLYHENHPRMLKVATALLNDPGRAEELTQEAFLIFLIKRPDEKGHPNLPGWLMKALHFLLSDEVGLARHRFEVTMPDDLEMGKEDDYHIPLSELLPKRLSKNDREILILVFEEGLSDEAIAKRLRISPSACRARLYRAKKRCKRAMEKESLRKSEKAVTKQPLQPI